MVVIDGMEERIERIMEVDINSFRGEKYGDYLSQEQVAREYFVKYRNRDKLGQKEKVVPSVEYRFGNKSIYLFEVRTMSKNTEKD